MSEAFELLKVAVTSSNIRRVAIIDDSFDVPVVEKNDLFTYLRDISNRAKCDFVAQEAWDAALEQVQGDEEDDTVHEVTESLYRKYIETGHSDFDPGNAFHSRSGNLKFLRPILELLSKCEDLQIDTYGTALAAIPQENLPDLVLIDLYLDPEISATVLPEDALGNQAISASVARVLELVKVENDPAIILMSSHGDKGREISEKYRTDLGGKVFASRFGFVDKSHIIKDATDNLAVEDLARDTLIDIFQTNKFGKALAKTLTRWAESAETAVSNIKKDIQKLELKEIAYLVQFRLDEEGQGLEEYLEWFFGEALQDHIIQEVDSRDAAGSVESDLKKSSVVSIDGACEPTSIIAEMYHRVRFENARTRPRKNFRLGDVYYNVVKKDVYAVMTPDCDLVLRNDGSRNAGELLLVPGRIVELEKVSASVGDFLMIQGDPKNISWEYQRLITRPFTECFANAGQSDETWKYLGTLRPLYAQEIQAHLLNQLGRVGVAVPPTIGMHALAEIVVKTDRGYQTLIDHTHGPTFTCSVLHGRSKNKKPRVVFDRYELKKIKEAFLRITPAMLIAGSATQLLNVINSAGGNIEKNLRKGLEVEKEIAHGITLVGVLPNPKTGPWAVMLINEIEKPEANVPHDALIDDSPEPIAAQVALMEGTLTSTLEQAKGH